MPKKVNLFIAFFLGGSLLSPLAGAQNASEAGETILPIFEDSHDESGHSYSQEILFENK